MSSNRPHRCPDCGWRGWAVETTRPAGPEDPRPSAGPEPDFAEIDRAVRRAPGPKAAAGGATRPALDETLKRGRATS